MKFICTVKRTQVWRDVEVEADSESQAEDLADIAIVDARPNDDYPVETIVREVRTSA